MKKQWIGILLSLTLLSAALLPLEGCAPSVRATDLMAGIEAVPPTAAAGLTQEEKVALADFYMALARNTAASAKNALLSPLSILSALSMTANGAGGETLRQMEEVLGLSLARLNEGVSAYLAALPSKKGGKLNLANSIWLHADEGLTVERAFLQANADHYGASVYQAPFDEGTRREINRWVSKQTDGMVEDLIRELPGDALIYLINALTFDGEWNEIYKEQNIEKAVFTTEGGEVRDVELMHSEEWSYLEHGRATGFLKDYVGGRYAFAALLPEQGLSVAEYLEDLTGQGLLETLERVQKVRVYAALPKYEGGNEVELSQALSALGIVDAFSPEQADFTPLARSDRGNLFISRVLHRTYIAVDERGTKAGAATAVEIWPGSAPIEAEPKTVRLDRPFVYLILDRKTNLPIFLGTMMDPEDKSGSHAGTETDRQEEESSHDVGEVDGVTMELVSVKDGMVTVRLKNEGEREYLYGERFAVESFADGIWNALPYAVDRGVFTAIGYMLEPGAEREWTGDVGWLYGILPAGRYRLVKTVMDVRGPGDYEEYALSAEFQLS